MFFFKILFLLIPFSFSQNNQDFYNKKEYEEFKKITAKKIFLTKENNLIEAKESFTNKSNMPGLIALTFDACDNKYNKELIDFLISENIPATLFLSGKWIDKNLQVAKELMNNPLFEIENHGYKHKICALTKEKIYNLKNTKNVYEMIDEIELNNLKIKNLSGRRPIFYRPAGAYIDNLCTKVASFLSMEVAGYDTLSGDSFSRTSAKEMSKNILRDAKHGMVVLMHLNHPERNEVNALKIAVPILRERGFSFCKLEDFSMK